MLTATAAAEGTKSAKLDIYRGSRIVGQETMTAKREAEGIRESYSTRIDAGIAAKLDTWLLRSKSGRPAAGGGSGQDFPWYEAPSNWRAATRGAFAFPISGPFPVGKQAALVRYWLSAGRPAEIATTSGKRVSILPCGRKRVGSSSGTVRLSCYEIAGLVWGRNLLWLDDRLTLKAAFVPTILGGASPFEVISDDVRSVRTELLKVAAQGAERLATHLPPAATASPRPLVLRDATLIDVAAGAAIPHSTIVIEGDRIAKVGAPSGIALPTHARVLNLAGKTVMPGLWDMHAHIKNADWGPAYLGTGITTVRDLGNDFEFIREFRRVANQTGALSPHVVLAGMIDATPQSLFYDYHAETPDLAVKWVRKYHSAGFEQIKIWENLPKDVLPALVAEAHRNGMTVTGHIPGTLSLREAVEAGQDQINHVGELLDALEPGSPGSFKTVDELVSFLSEKHVVVDPTLVIADFRLNKLDQPLTVFEPGAREIPPDLAKADQGLRGRPGNPTEQEAMFRKALDLVRALHQHGVPIVAGSDQGIPGYSLIREVELYVEAGFTPIDAIRSATLVPAQVMGMAGRVGAVAPGMRADLLILDGNPLQEISALRSGCGVMKSGRLYNMRALRAAAGFQVTEPKPRQVCGAVVR